MEIFLLFLSILNATAHAESKNSIPNEWILTLNKTRLNSDTLVSQLGEEWELKQRVGTSGHFLLLKGPSTLGRGAQTPWGDLQPNYLYRGLDQLDPDFEKSWGLSNSGQIVPGLETGVSGRDIGAAKAWALTTGSRDVVVAILDWQRDQSPA